MTIGPGSLVLVVGDQHGLLTTQLCETIRDRTGRVEKAGEDGHWWVIIDGERALIYETELKELNP
jgi:hypothetical protein